MLAALTTRGQPIRMKRVGTATPVLHRRVVVRVDAFVELKITRVPSPVDGCSHPYKYGLALVVRRECVLRYDNERGKGDHRHIGATEMPYVFSTVEQLIADFMNDVRRLLDEHA